MGSKIRQVLQGISNAESIAMQGAIENANKKAEGEVKEIDRQLESFKHLSSTIASNIAQSGDRRKKKDIARAKAIYMDESLAHGMDPEKKDKYNAGKQALIETDTKLNEASVKAQNKGSSYHEAAKLHGLSGWGLYTYSALKASAAAGGMEDWIKGQMLNNETLEVKYGGETFTPNKAETLEQKAAAINALREKYFQDTDLIYVSDELLDAEGHYKTMAEGVQNAYGEYATQDSVNKSNTRIHEAVQMFGETGDLGQLISKVAAQRNDEGELYNNEGALDYVINNVLDDQMKAGTLRSEVYEQLKDQEVPWAKGKTFGQHYKTRFATLEQSWIKANKDLADVYGDEQIGNGKKLENNIIKALYETNPDTGLPNYVDATEKDWNEAINKVKKESKGFYDATHLSSLRLHASASNESIRKFNAEFTELAKSGLLDVSMLEKVPLAVRTKWMETAVAQTEARQQAGGYKAEIKALETEIKTHLGIEALEEKGATPTLIHQELTTMFLQKAQTYRDLGVENATQRALLETAKHYKDNQSLGGRYAVGLFGRQGNFENAVFAGSKDKNDVILRRHAEITKIVADKEGKDLQDLLGKEDFLFTKDELESMADGYGEPGWEINPRVNLYSRLFGVRPFEIINKQRKAHGLKEMTPPEIVVRQEKLSPFMAAIIENNNSVNRSTRAWGSTGTYDETLIQENKRSTINTSSKASGADPGTCAALVEASGSWEAEPDTITGLCTALGEGLQGTAGSQEDIEAALLKINPDIDLLQFWKSKFKYGDRSALIKLKRPALR